VRGLGVTLLSAAILLAPKLAFALSCTGHPVKTDTFASVDESWAKDRDAPTVEENRLKVKPPQGGRTLIYKGIRPPDAGGEICVSLRSPNALSDPSATEAGIVFRAARVPGSDEYRYCFFALSPDGTARLRHCAIQPTWVIDKSWPDVAGARKGQGANNELRVRLRHTSIGIAISLWVNDEKLELEALPFPPLIGGGEVGLRAVSERNQIDTWKFSNFAVTELPE
jgi:hypothetical protein